AISNAVRDHLNRSPDRLPKVIALTTDDAASTLAGRLPPAIQTPRSPSLLPISADDMAKVARFYASAINTLKALRDRARARGDAPGDRDRFAKTVRGRLSPLLSVPPRRPQLHDIRAERFSDRIASRIEHALELHLNVEHHERRAPRSRHGRAAAELQELAQGG